MPAPSASLLRRLLGWLYVLVVTVVVPCAVVAVAVYEDPGLSPLDEVAHLDYLDRANDASLARMGDTVSSEIAVLARCRTIEVDQGIPCDEVDIPDGPIAAADGYSYQAQHPPIYYWSSAALQRITSIGPAENFITTGRLTGMFWLASATGLLYAALRKLAVGTSVSGAICVFLAVSPGVVYSVAKVTNDATSLLAGSSLLFAYLHTRERPDLVRMTALCAVAVAVVLLKPVNVIAVGAIALTALFDLTSSLGWRRAFLRTLAVGGAGMLSVVGWQIAVDLLGRVDTYVVMDALLEFKDMSDGPPIGQFLFSAAGLVIAYEAGDEVVGAGAASFAVLNRLVLYGTALTSALRGRRSVGMVLGTSAIAMAIIAGFAFNVQFWASFGLRGGPAARYGLSLLPLLAVPLAIEAGRTRRATVGLWLASVTMGAGSFIGIILNT